MNERNLIGYGMNPPQANWPHNSKIAISFVLNYEEGGEHTLLNGDLRSEVFLNETPGGQPRQNKRDMNMETQYEYGSRVGVWRIMKLFEKYHYKFTCFAVGRAVELNPACIKAMHDLGHEIASHNHKWIDFEGLSVEEEIKHIHSAINAIKNVIGEAPKGWYTGRISENSRRLVYEEYEKLGLELLYDCDAYNDDLVIFINSHIG